MMTSSGRKRVTENNDEVNPTFTKILTIAIAVVLAVEIWFVL